MTQEKTTELKQQLSQLKKEIICLKECEGAFVERINELQKKNIEGRERIIRIIEGQKLKEMK